MSETPDLAGFESFDDLQQSIVSILTLVARRKNSELGMYLAMMDPIQLGTVVAGLSHIVIAQRKRELGFK